MVSKLAATFLIFLMSLMPVSTSLAGFSDITGSKYKDAIEDLNTKGIINGYWDGTFKPDREISRAELTKMIFKSDVDNLKDKTNLSDCFSDVKTEWFAEYICHAKNTGIVGGYTDGTFRPGRFVNFAEALKITIEGEAIGVGANPAKDQPWYKPYVSFVALNNIYRKADISPDKNITRGELSLLLSNILKYKTGTLPPGQTDAGGGGAYPDVGPKSPLYGETMTSRDGISVPSLGCTLSSSQPPDTSVNVGGADRKFITVMPGNYSQTRTYPIIFAFHGRTNSNSNVQSYFQLDKAADGNAFIIYPDGRLPLGVWQNPGDLPADIRDFKLFDALLSYFSEKYCIDQNKVFLAGHSLGAWFANTLACARADKVRALASVAGGITTNTCPKAVNALLMHNPEDNLYTFDNGERARDHFKQLDQCTDDTKPVEPLDYNCVQYTSCSSEATLVWCPENDSTDWRGGYYPHTWPDHAGADIWKFFQSFR